MRNIMGFASGNCCNMVVVKSLWIPVCEVSFDFQHLLCPEAEDPAAVFCGLFPLGMALFLSKHVGVLTVVLRSS